MTKHEVEVDQVEVLRHKFTELLADYARQGDLREWEDLLLEVHKLPESIERLNLQDQVLECWHTRKKYG